MPKAKTKIKEILDGIDRDQADDGWWETSTGVVIFPGHWKRYDCPEGCGLQKGKR